MNTCDILATFMMGQRVESLFMKTKSLVFVLSIALYLNGIPALSEEAPLVFSNTPVRATLIETNWFVVDIGPFEQTGSILKFLLEEFKRLVGQEIMLNEICVVYNDSQADCPMLLLSEQNVFIRLVQKDVFWEPKTVFQLSHEMCHYAFRQFKDNKDFTLSWFEEIVCEAVSLYALEYLARNGQNCRFFQERPTLSMESNAYLYYELSMEGTDGLKQCDSVTKLAEYEKQRVAENHREAHKNEMHAVYRAISANPEELRCVLNYTKYLEDNGVVIDFGRWIQDTPCDLLNCLKQIQPVKQEPSHAN